MDYNQHQTINRRINGVLNNLSIHNLLLIILFIFTNHLRSSYSQDLTLVTSVLRTFQAHACDGQSLQLNCKPDTVINILFAQYVFANNQVCSTNSTVLNGDKPKNCTESLRYSLLQKVELTCRNQSSCVVDSSTRSLGVTDQCPNIAKYAEVAYRCRPYIFQNKIACSEKSMDISCPSGQRILIYFALFGTLNKKPDECAKNTIPHQLLKAHQTNFIKEPFQRNCQAKQVTKMVADHCHTKSKCSIGSHFSNFQFPDCINDLTNDEKQFEVHLKVAFVCVQDEDLRGSQISNRITNSITNNFNNAIIERKNHRPQTNKTKDPVINNYEPSTSTQNSISLNNKPELTDLIDNNLLPATEFNNGNDNKLFNHQDETVHPTDIDNIQAAVRSNEQSSWPHISNSNQPKSIEPFKDWNSFYQYIETNLERLLIYLLIALCVALLFCFIFLGLSHLTEKKNKKNDPQCASLECSVQEDCCDSKPDLSSSVSLNKANQGLSIFAGFEADNPAEDEIIGELHRNGSFIRISQQLNNQLNAQLQHCKPISSSMLLSAAVSDSSAAGLLNYHQLNNQINSQLSNQFSNQMNNRFTSSTFSPTHHNHNYNSIDKYNFLQNTMYQTDQINSSPQKITSVPQSASFYNMQTYTPIYTSPTNHQTIVGNVPFQPQNTIQQQQSQTTFQQLQPAQLLISNQSDNENGSTTTTMTTIGSQTDSSASSTEMQITNGNNSLNGIHPTHTSAHNVYNNQINSISPSNFNPVTLQILTTPSHLNDVQLSEATVFQ